MSTGPRLSAGLRKNHRWHLEPYVRQTKWDLLVIDEALRHVYKKRNKMAEAIEGAQPEALSTIVSDCAGTSLPEHAR